MTLAENNSSIKGVNGLSRGGWGIVSAASGLGPGESSWEQALGPISLGIESEPLSFLQAMV